MQPLILMYKSIKKIRTLAKSNSFCLKQMECKKYYFNLIFMPKPNNLKSTKSLSLKTIETFGMMKDYTAYTIESTG